MDSDIFKDVPDPYDFRGGDSPEVVGDKMLAYAYILTHEGYPCVYWKDWFTYGLAEPGKASGIERLVEVHESNAGGGTNILYADDVFYVMERTGAGSQPGLVFALNNLGEAFTVRVRTGFRNRTLKPLAWRGRDSKMTPGAAVADGDGWCQVEAPPRGYTVYGL